MEGTTSISMEPKSWSGVVQPSRVLKDDTCFSASSTSVRSSSEANTGSPPMTRS